MVREARGGRGVVACSSFPYIGTASHCAPDDVDESSHSFTVLYHEARSHSWCTADEPRAPSNIRFFHSPSGKRHVVSGFAHGGAA